VSIGPADAEAARAALDKMVWVDAPDGGAPDLQFDPPVALRAQAVRIITPGDGPVIERGMWVRYHFISYWGKNREVWDDTWKSSNPYEAILNPTGSDPELIAGLAGQKVGVKLVYGRFSSPDNPSEAVQASATGIMAIEVIDAGTPADRAEGAPVTPPPGLPKVTLAADGRPAIAFAKGAAPPAKLVSQTLIEGGGAVIQPESLIAYKFSEWVWDGAEVGSTWTSPDVWLAPLEMDLVLAAIKAGVVGHTIGSQILIIAPPDLAYGEDGLGDAVPPNATVAIVVDVVGGADPYPRDSPSG
jgi:peptidylprolyl isomerase